MNDPEMNYEEGLNWPCLLILLYMIFICGLGCYGIWRLMNLIIH
jgi:hypothetical protein